VTPYAEANHHPVAVVNGDQSRCPIEMTASAGAKVTLDASRSTDPDGDSLTCQWSVYREVGTYKSPIEIANAKSFLATIHVPHDAAGKNFHIILMLSDDDDPSLVSYRRVIATVK
jgi:hypothetical protein